MNASAADGFIFLEQDQSDDAFDGQPLTVEGAEELIASLRALIDSGAIMTDEQADIGSELHRALTAVYYDPGPTLVIQGFVGPHDGSTKERPSLQIVQPPWGEGKEICSVCGALYPEDCASCSSCGHEDK
jgi:hypothetical protein